MKKWCWNGSRLTRFWFPYQCLVLNRLTFVMEVPSFCLRLRCDCNDVCSTNWSSGGRRRFQQLMYILMSHQRVMVVQLSTLGIRLHCCIPVVASLLLHLSFLILISDCRLYLVVEFWSHIHDPVDIAIFFKCRSNQFCKCIHIFFLKLRCH